jgi:hypothetical protein
LTAERTGPAGQPRIAVLADDLIWATRLADALRRAGGEPVPVRSAGALAAVLPTVEGAIVDLTARAYDGLNAVRAAAAAGVTVAAVGQHDDVPLRRAAKAAGATRIWAYRTVFEHRERELSAWLAVIDRRSEGA